MTESGGLFTSCAVTCIFNAFVSYTAIMLNILTILALRKTSSLPKRLKTLLLSLAVSDLGIGLVVQPLHISRLAMELQTDTDRNSYHNICSAVHKTGVVFFYASFLGVSALTVDRFLAIRLHLRYNELVTHRRVVALTILIWLFNAFTSMASVWIPKKCKSRLCCSYCCCLRHRYSIFLLQDLVSCATPQNSNPNTSSRTRHLSTW